MGIAKATVAGPSMKWINFAPLKYLSYDTSRVSKTVETIKILIATGFTKGLSFDFLYK